MSRQISINEPLIKENKYHIVDPGKTEKRFKNNKTEFENEIIETFIYQSSQGLNVSKVKKGKRSFARLNALRSRMKAWETWIKRYYNKKILEVNEEEIIGLANKLDEGIITRINGERYKSAVDYVKDFKTFWFWYIKYMKKNHKIDIHNIVQDLSAEKSEKPKFHYFDFDSFKKMVDSAQYTYKVPMWFMYDTGIRAPKEMCNIRVSDISEDKNSNKLNLHIRDEISKTFGRKIRLMLCSDMIKEWIKRNNLKSDDYIFNFDPIMFNRYLGKLGYDILNIGEKIKKIENGNTKYYYRGGITMYDFRHAAACYWLPKYPSESALKYRFGWRKTKMIEYYTEFLGMKDTISEDDLIDSEAKSRIEKELELEKKRREMLEENFKSQMDEMNKHIAMLSANMLDKSRKKDDETGKDKVDKSDLRSVITTQRKIKK